MERAFAYVISAGIVGFGVWILIVGLSTIAPRFLGVRGTDPHRDWAPQRSRRVLDGHR